MKDHKRTAWLVTGALGLLTAALGSELSVDELVVGDAATLKGNVTITNTVTTTGVGGEGILLHLTFDNDSGGTVTDSSPNPLHGTASGGYTYVADRQGGQAIQLDGSTAWVSVPFDARWHLTNYTLTAWIKTPEAGGDRARIISHQYHDGYWLMALHANVLEFGSWQACPSVIAKGPDLSDDAWHLVAVVRDSDTGVARWVVDGEEEGTETFSSMLPDVSTVAELAIGRLYSGGEYFAGLIDDVRVYGRALSLSELYSLYSGQTGYATVTNPASFRVDAPAVLAGETTILRLTPQGDISMGDYTNRP